MPLKPDVARLLAVLEQVGGPDLSEMTPAEARAAFATTAATSPRAEVASVVDHLVAGPHGEFTVRVYRPATAGDHDLLPVLVWFHGGGWVVGDLETADPTCRALANRSGCCVVSVDYHLAPEHPYPAAVDDAVSAIEWVAARSGDLTVDAHRLAVGGDSAGGNLAAVAAQLLAAARGPKPRFQLLVYPATDLTLSHPSIDENGEGHLLTKATMRWFVTNYVGGRDATNPRMSPLRSSDLSGLPPALVITAEFDPLRDEGEAYAHALQQAGVACELRRYDGQIHLFIGLFGMIEDGDVALTHAAHALRDALA